jgi:hypothetical protein
MGGAQASWQAIWPELAKGIPAAFVALMIGLVAGGIAWRQFKVARAKLNLDLFEHRYEVYNIVWAYLSVRGKGGDEMDIDYNNAVPKAYFLFGQEIGDFMVECMQHTIIVSLAVQRLAEMPGDGADRERLARETAELLDFWSRETHGLRERFGPYMNFGEWR